MTSVGFTGTRQGMTHAQWIAFIDELGSGPGEFHHGGAIGADMSAHTVALESGWSPHVHPPNVKWYSSLLRLDPVTDHGIDVTVVFYDPLPPLKRNHVIVDSSERLIATPAGPEVLRSGTWATVRYARKRGKSITIVYPDGRIENESF